MAAVDHPYLDVSVPIGFAHRGGTRAHPENTLAAFEHAVSLGFHYLETDVHVSADGILIAFHDENLLRTCGVDADITDLTWAEIEPLRVDGAEPIPRLRELLERFPEHRFNIDAKSDGSVEPLLALVDELDAFDRVLLASSRHRRLRRLRRHGRGRLATNLSQVEVPVLWALGWLPGRSARAAQVPTTSGPLTLVTERFLRSAHRRGIPVHVWTIDDPAEVNRLLDLGVDGIMTDDPESLRGVYVERGIWPLDPPEGGA